MFNARGTIELVAVEQDGLPQLVNEPDESQGDGGQIWPWHAAVMLQQGGLLAGRYTFGGTQLYVSRGTGHWGPAVRIGAPAEISRITLRCAD